MLRRLGYVAVSLSIRARANRTLILRRATSERLRQLIERNLAGLQSILEYNVNHQILLFRIGSQIIPFGGHPANTVPWREEFAEQLQMIGDFTRRNRLRLSFHPGQFTLLSSPDEGITSAAIRDLTWHTEFLDSLGLDGSHKVVIHGGGAYGDKTAALERWTSRYQQLPPPIQRRLVLENDERIYTVADVLGVSDRVGVPVVFDYLHHQVNPGDEPWSMTEIFQQCFATWGDQDGPPKVHFSSQRQDGPPGAHADHVDDLEFIRFLDQAPPQHFDCMLEVKAKDLALFRLRDALRQRGFVEEEFNT